MRVDKVEAGPGSTARGYIEIGHYPDMPFYSPIMIARGRKVGPTLWIQCLVHGPEIVGPISVARFFREIDLEQLAGSIVALLVANPLGFRAYNRLTPQDGANLNRVFPGKPDGSVSEQIAHRVLDLAMRHGDVLLDLHSGGDLTITAFYVIYAKLDSDGSREARRLAAQVGSRYQWGSNEGWLKGAAFSNFTRRTGKPALIIESGGGGRVTDEDLANFRTGLFGLTRAMGMLPGAPPVAEDVRGGGNALHLKATRGGFWQPLIAPGDDVVAGQELGRIVDVFGDVAETVTCPFGQAWIGSIRRPWMGVYGGDQVIEIVERVEA
jgi:uncharacterized protein